MGNPTPSPTALVSWAHRDPTWSDQEAEAWSEQVDGFAKALRRTGIDVRLDRWVQDPSVDWPRWSLRMIEECDFVVVAMSQRWADCWRGVHDPRTNAGLENEIQALHGRHAVDQEEFRLRTVIVLLEGIQTGEIPLNLQFLPRFHIRAVDPVGLVDLIRALTRTPERPIPEMGRLADHVAQRMSAARPIPAPERPDEPAIDRRTATAPNQLPWSARRLVNRHREIKLIDKRVARAQAHRMTSVIVLAGGPGVGKSAIGRHWATAHRGEFEGGVLYAALDDFRRSDGAAVSEVLGHFLRGLGVPEDRLANGLAERVDMFRARTTSSRILVVLDDVHFPAEVVPLTPAGAGGVMIVTSHHAPRELLADGARVVEVQPLDATHARLVLREMLEKKSRLSDEPDAVGELIELCCGLPVALGICAGRLAGRSRLTVRQLVDDIRNGNAVLRRLSHPGGQRQTSVQACFDSCYAHLWGVNARVYRIIGLHPGLAFRADAIEAAAGPGVDIPAVLDDLADAHVIDDLAAGRFGMHQLLHEHARSAASKDLTVEEVESIVSRTVDHYLRMCQLLDRALVADRWRLAEQPSPEDVPDFRTRPAAFGWFESERATIVAAMRTAVDQDRPDVVWRFGEALWPAYDYHHHLDEAVAVFTMAQQAARRVGRTDAQARLQAQVARALVERGELVPAERMMREAVDLAASTGNDMLRASVTEGLGWVQLHAGEYAAASARFVEARGIFLGIGRGRGVALQDYLLGQAYMGQGLLPRATAHLEAALANPALVDDALMRTRIRLRLGVVRVRDGRVDEGRQLLDDVIGTARTLAASEVEVAALMAAADAAAGSDDRAAQRRYLVRAAEVLADPTDPRTVEIDERISRLSE